jgi:hypothetical protein
MVDVPDQVYGLVASQITQGSGLGESIPELAARVDQVLSATGTARWANRSTVVARTEAIGAANFGRYDSFQAMAEEFPDEQFELMWLATLDGKTRGTHQEADGQRVPQGDPFIVGGAMMRFPGDPFGPSEETIQCRCTTLMVRPGEAVDTTDRQFIESGADLPEVPEGMADFHASTAPSELASTVADVQAGGVGPGRTRLSGGVSADTELVQLTDGRTVVHKRGMDWGDADLASEVRRQADAEQLTSRLGQQIGAPVPEVLRTEADAVWIEHLQGATPGGAHLVDTPEGVRLGLLDTLSAGMDRNPGNMLVKDGQLFGIDHGFSYGTGLDSPASPGTFPGVSPVAKHFVSDNGTSYIDNALSSGDIDYLSARLAELRPDYAKLGRSDWLDYSLSVLEQLRPHAKGGGLYG